MTRKRILLFQPKLDEISVPWALLYISAQLDISGLEVTIPTRISGKAWQNEVKDCVLCYG